MKNRILPVLAATLVVTACGEKSAEEVVAETPAEPEAEAPAVAPAVLQRSPSTEGARVFFITPADGDTVTSPLRIEFGIEGMSAPTTTVASASGWPLFLPTNLTRQS